MRLRAASEWRDRPPRLRAHARGRAWRRGVDRQSSRTWSPRCCCASMNGCWRTTTPNRWGRWSPPVSSSTMWTTSSGRGPAGRVGRRMRSHRSGRPQTVWRMAASIRSRPARGPRWPATRRRSSGDCRIRPSGGSWSCSTSIPSRWSRRTWRGRVKSAASVGTASAGAGLSRDLEDMQRLLGPWLPGARSRRDAGGAAPAAVLRLWLAELLRGPAGSEDIGTWDEAEMERGQNRLDQQPRGRRSLRAVLGETGSRGRARARIDPAGTEDLSSAPGVPCDASCPSCLAACWPATTRS